jgi:phage repressor protein C with HTH and peptisase S24 domain
MEPTLYDGDVIVVNLADALPREGEVFAINMEGEPVVKRLTKQGGEWLAASDNQDKRRYRDKPLSPDAIVVGRVIYRQSEHI